MPAAGPKRLCGLTFANGFVEQRYKTAWCFTLCLCIIVVGMRGSGVYAVCLGMNSPQWTVLESAPQSLSRRDFQSRACPECNIFLTSFGSLI